MRTRDKLPIPMTGASSMLVIFAVLCLTVFALLSVSTAEAYRRLSDASLKAVTDYYKADSEAELIFARLRSGEDVAEVKKSGDRYAYSCVISQTQTLEVELLKQDGSWLVCRWQAVPVESHEYDDSLSVWDGLSS